MTKPCRNLPYLRALLLAVLVLASALACDRATAEDMLIVSNGVKTGAVEGYADAICTFDGAPVPRASIYFIGLNAKLPMPTPRDSMHDEVHLRDGSVHPERLVSIDADNVVTEGASYSRREVDWIWLTPVQSGEGQAAPGTTTSGAEEAEDEAGSTYVWKGTITAENRYDGSEGRHVWQAEYRVEFLEVPTTSSLPGRAIGTSFVTNDFVALEFDYEFHVDQNWNKGAHALQTNAAGKIIYGDVTMRGAARGRLGGDRSRDGRLLLGQMLRIETPMPVEHAAATSFATEAEYSEYMNNMFMPIEPGWYNISIGSGSLPPHEKRALYAGIERGGQEPPFFADPDADFLHWIPSWMPDGTNVIGRLDRPDQAEVRGGYTFPRQGPGGPEDREQITLEWSFTRMRK